MAAVPSTMMPLGTIAPEFSLLNVVSGNFQSLSELKSPKGTLILFICNHCKYVKHIHAELISLCNSYTNLGFSIVAISSNDVVNYPEDSPELMKKLAQDSSYKFPYLYDETQDIAKAYDAACTPDLFLFDGSLKLVYRGQFDGSRPSNDIQVTGNDLKSALDSLIKGEKLSENQIPSIGCNIKWKD